jgi:hypothetical protein
VRDHALLARAAALALRDGNSSNDNNVQETMDNLLKVRNPSVSRAVTASARLDLSSGEKEQEAEQLRDTGTTKRWLSLHTCRRKLRQRCCQAAAIADAVRPLVGCTPCRLWIRTSTTSVEGSKPRSCRRTGSDADRLNGETSAAAQDFKARKTDTLAIDEGPQRPRKVEAVLQKA